MDFYIKVKALHKKRRQPYKKLAKSAIMYTVNRKESWDLRGNITIMKLKLVKASFEYQNQIINMLEEWIDYNSITPSANRSPWAIFQNDFHDFEYYINRLDIIKPEEGKVPASTYFCLDENRNFMLGAVNIRHYLNEYLLEYGGHIGYGIRPSERRKGYASAMIGIALKKCKILGIDKVLLVCNKDNIGSAKAIINNGGVLENEVIKDGEIMQRYWIDVDRQIPVL